MVHHEKRTGPPDGLTDRQRRFVEEYLIDLNATAAYRRAGYQSKANGAAGANAARLIGNDKVQRAIAEAQAARAARLGIEADDVLRELAAIAFSDLGQVLDFTGTAPRLRPAQQIPAAARKALAAVKVRRFTEGKGAAARAVEVTEFKLWDKLAALEKLGRHLGLWKDAAPAGKQVDVQFLVGVSEAELLGREEPRDPARPAA
jgi:phage terminase small subunit